MLLRWYVLLLCYLSFSRSFFFSGPGKKPAQKLSFVGIESDSVVERPPINAPTDCTVRQAQLLDLSGVVNLRVNVFYPEVSFCMMLCICSWKKLMLYHMHTIASPHPPSSSTLSVSLISMRLANVCSQFPYAFDAKDSKSIHRGRSVLDCSADSS